MIYKMSTTSRILISLLLLSLFLCISCQPTTPFTPQDYMSTLTKNWYSVCSSKGLHTPEPFTDIDYLPEQSTYSIQAGKDVDCIAYAYYNDSQSEVGWGYLHIESNAAYSSSIQLHGAGFLESYLTHTRIWQAKQNLWQDYFIPNGGPRNTTLAYATTMIHWNLKMIKDRKSYDDFWHQVGLTYHHLQGIFEGYQAFAPEDEPLTWMDIFILNSVGDWGDWDRTANPPTPPLSTDSPPLPYLDGMNRGDHCSALIKVTEDNLFFGHGTWDSFCNMLRIFKLYSFALPNVSNTRTHFSSYPGVLDSYDDFYVLEDSMIAVTETTNSIYNRSVYDANSATNSVPTWIRVIVANRMASEGADWANYFSQFNSGSYNSQWMVLDYKRYSPGQPLQQGTLWVISPMPGLVKAADVTDVLESQGYWASYNIPYFEELYVAMGYQALLDQYGPWEWSYSQSYRASIFAREQANIFNLTDMQRTLTWNHWKTDPVSRGDAGHAIQARYDLSPANHTSGGIDAKLTSYVDLLAGGARVFAHSGPTHFWADDPPFDWSAWPQVPSLGMPTVYDFQFQAFYNDDNPTAALPVHALPRLRNPTHHAIPIGIDESVHVNDVYPWRQSLLDCWTQANCSRALIISHGGDWDLTRPYDSMPAFIQAVKDGTDCVKGDFRVSQDGVGMIMHSSPIQWYESLDCAGMKVEDNTAARLTQCHMALTSDTFITVNDLLGMTDGQVNTMLCVKQSSDIARAIEILIELNATDRTFLEIKMGDFLSIVPTLPNYDQVYYVAEGGSYADLQNLLSKASPTLLSRAFMFEFDPSWPNWGMTNVSQVIQTQLHPAGVRSMGATSTFFPSVDEHEQLFTIDGFDVVYSYDTPNGVQARTWVDQQRGVVPP